MNRKNNIKQNSNSKNKKNANFNNRNYNKKKDETLPLIEEEYKKENRYKSEKKNHLFTSNNKATKKNNDIFTKYHSNNKLFLNNKEDAKPIENSFLRKFCDNLRQNIPNKYGRVSSANKVP